MVNSKKYTKDEILDLIAAKFGSVEEYAATKGVTKQNIYSRSNRRSPKFMKELEGVLAYRYTVSVHRS